MLKGRGEEGGGCLCLRVRVLYMLYGASSILLILLRYYMVVNEHIEQNRSINPAEQVGSCAYFNIAGT